MEGDSISRDTAAGMTRACKGVHEGEAREGNWWREAGEKGVLREGVQSEGEDSGIRFPGNRQDPRKAGRWRKKNLWSGPWLCVLASGRLGRGGWQRGGPGVGSTSSRLAASTLEPQHSLGRGQGLRSQTYLGSNPPSTTNKPLNLEWETLTCLLLCKLGQSLCLARGEVE